jgi:glycosyltransferase involved in cell wall biosynthesis
VTAGSRPRRRRARRVLALVAARNEEATIGRTVKALSEVPAVNEVVVVSDGSFDRTVEEAQIAGARVLNRERRVGKGRALDGAVDRLPRADVYLFVDGDVGEPASEVRTLLDPVLRGELDMAIARFPRLAGGGFGVVKGMAAWLIRHGTAFDAQEPLSGQRAITHEALWACRPLADGFGLETALTIDAARLGFRIGEIPVEMTHRATGRSLRGFAHRGRQGLDILRATLPRLAGLR